MTTCTLILCDAAYRILWISECPADIPIAEVLGKHPWDFLTGEDARNFQAAMCRAMADKEQQTFDFFGERIGYWRAWCHFCPLTEVRLSILARRTPDYVRDLTPRERDICRLLVNGLTSKEIAAKLDISRKTVDVHRSNVAQRMGISLKHLTAWCGSNFEWF